MLVDELELNLDTPQQDSFADFIMQRYFRAAAERRSHCPYNNTSVDSWLHTCLAQYCKTESNRNMNLTRIKVGALHAKVKDMVINAADAPFTIEPTPVPVLSKEQNEQVTKSVEEILGQKLIEGGIVVMGDDGKIWPDYSRIVNPTTYEVEGSVAKWLDGVVAEQKQTMQIEATKIASKAAKHVTRLMQDQMLEGGWRDSYLNCLFDIFLYGTGVLRMEQRRVQSLKWSGDNMAPSTDDIITWRHVPIRNCYPSPDSEDAQVGSYFIERGAMRKQDLLAATQVSWIDEVKLHEAMEKAEDNCFWIDSYNDPLGPISPWNQDSLVDVLIHEGTVQGAKLLDWFEGTTIKIKEEEFYDIEAWVLAGIVIGCRVLKHPHMTKTYFSANFQKVDRNFWGIGAGMTLNSLEGWLNKYLDDLHENMELTVAPPIFYDADMFISPENITLTKRAKIPFNPDAMGGSPRSPFYQVHFESKSAELINLINWLYRMADDESGIPGLLSGNDQLSGGEATFRGMKMLAASANTLIKDAFLNIDQTMIQPAMEALWRWNMLNSKDKTIKADTVVVARGAAGLMQREIADAERADVLPVLLQLVQAAQLPPDQAQRIMNYLLQQTMLQGGIPVDELIPNFEAATEQSSVVQSLEPATPEPTIGADQNTGGLSPQGLM